MVQYFLEDDSLFYTGDHGADWVFPYLFLTTSRRKMFPSSHLKVWIMVTEEENKNLFDIQIRENACNCESGTTMVQAVTCCGR